ncbi:MAG: hypothetical protein JWP38_1550 [Herbaspirillum sp.]|nr:hypothetical protein [Herbaspirillum sp.]
MLCAAGLPSSSVYPTPRSKAPSQVAAANTKPRMRWTPAKTRAATATGKIAEFEELAQRLERYDNKNLGDYASAQRVQHHASRLSTDELMALPGDIRKARISAGNIIEALKTRGQEKNLPVGLLLACEKSQSRINALLNSLKNIRPLSRRHAFEADGAGRLVRTDAAQPPSATTPMFARRTTSVSQERLSPVDRAFFDSLRSPPASPRSSPSASRSASPRPSIATSRCDSAPELIHRRQQQEAVRERKLWSTPIAEKTDMRRTLLITRADTAHCLDQRFDVLTTQQRGSLIRAWTRINAIHEKFEKLSPTDLSQAARTIRRQARDEHIRARNLLDNFESKGAATAKPKPAASSTPADRSFSDKDGATPVKVQRKTWTREKFTYDLRPQQKHGYGSEESIGTESDSGSTSEHLSSGSDTDRALIPNWLIDHLKNKGDDPVRYCEPLQPIRAPLKGILKKSKF